MTFDQFLKHSVMCEDFWSKFRKRKRNIKIACIAATFTAYFQPFVAAAILGWTLSEWRRHVQVICDMRTYMVIWARAYLTRDHSAPEVAELQKHYLYPYDPDIVYSEYLMHAPDWTHENRQIAVAFIGRLPILPKPRDPRLIQQLAEVKICD